MSSWLTLPRNLWFGLKLTLFRPVKWQDFRASWGAYWGISLIYALVICLSDYIDTAPPRHFYGEAAGIMVLTRSMLILLAATLAAALLQRGQRVLHLAVMALNAFILPWALVIAAYIWLPQMAGKGNIADDVRMIEYCWIYLIAFRCAMLLFNNLRAFLAAALLTGAMLVNSFYLATTFWEHDYRDEAEGISERKDRLSAEDVLQNQHNLLDAALAPVKRAPVASPTLYGVIFGSYSYQDVFMKEARFVEDTLGKLFNLRGRMVVMINNEKTAKEVPLATSVNLRETLTALGKRMKREDVLVLYLTSHGSAQRGVAVEMDDFGLRDIAPNLLADMFKQSGIKNRVVIVSACYSGTMIEPLKTPDTLVITAAAKDRTSFGCSDEADLTYFAEAYFKQALPKHRDFIAAFDEAKQLVAEREKKEGIEPHSEPQIFIGDNIRKDLGLVMPASAKP